MASSVEEELRLLREENAALLEALHIAQRGGVDLQGHLSKWNPHAADDGIFAQDWELRYFILSGSLLKYYTSERDIGYLEPRGVLELLGCTVEVELPLRPSGPFIFQIVDTDGELLLRLSADRLATAKTWVRTLAAAGLTVHGFGRLPSSKPQGHHQLRERGGPGATAAAAGAAARAARPGAASLTSSSSAPHVLTSLDSDNSLFRQQAQQQGDAAGGGACAARAQGLRAAAFQRLSGLSRLFHHRPEASTTASAGSENPSILRLGKPEAAAAAAAATVSDAESREQQQQPDVWLSSDEEDDSSSVGDADEASAAVGAGVVPGAAAGSGSRRSGSGIFGRPGSRRFSCSRRALSHLRQMSGAPCRASSALLMRAVTSRRWNKADLGDELPTMEQQADLELHSELEQLRRLHTLKSEQEELPEQLAAAGSATAAGAAAAAAAAAAATAAAATPPPTPPPSAALQRVASVKAAASGDATAAAAAAAAAAGLAQPAGGAGAAGPVAAKRPGMTGASPVHITVKDSILTDQRDWGLKRHEGILNLGALLLLATNIRMIMSNLMTYGLRLQLDSALLPNLIRHVLVTSWDDALTWAATPGCALFAAAALLIELLGLRLMRAEQRSSAALSKKDVPGEAVAKAAAAAAARTEALMLLLNCLNVGASLLLPCGLVLTNKSSLIPAFALTAASIVICMKLSTYAHCNTTLRQELRAAAAAGQQQQQLASEPSLDTPFGSQAAPAAAGSSQPGARQLVAYPDNLEARDVGYFLLAPTLTYQLNFPRSRKVRRHLLWRWLWMLLMTGLIMSFMQVQFLLPCMQSSLEPLAQMNLPRFMEQLLRLSVPNVAGWLAMFYLVFHLWLNILGEALRFGDRVFYKEWWNAATLADYWKLWNVPVHKFMLRTVYFPLVRRRVGKLPAMLVVFFVSALMHELAVGVPLRMLRGWAFIGMLMQVPLIILTEVLRKRIKSDSIGNFVFWASFCVLGQPMCLILYYYDWLVDNVGAAGLAQAAAAGGSFSSAAGVGSGLLLMGAAALNSTAVAA